MANKLDDIFPKILSGALETLRETAIMPQIVNTDYGNDAANKGQVINVPIPTAMEAQDVVPGPYSQNTRDLEINTAKIPLNNWKEVPFYLTDKDIMEIIDGADNMQIQEAAKALANEIDKSLLALYSSTYNFTGTPGLTPFGNSTVDAQEARKFLNLWGTPMRDRRIVLDVDAEANAIGLPAFQHAGDAGTDVTIREGVIGRKIGFDWYYDQLNPYHQAGTIAPKVNGPLTNGAFLAGSSSILVDGLTSGNVVVGDVFKLANSIQTYVVTQAASVNGGAIQLVFAPALQVAVPDNTAVSFYDSHAVNLAFHRDAFALAVRPLQQEQIAKELGGSQIETMVDPVTGLPLRLEVRREHKRTRWSLDVLWGVQLIRPECAVRIAG